MHSIDLFFKRLNYNQDLHFRSEFDKLILWHWLMFRYHYRLMALQPYKIRDFSETLQIVSDKYGFNDGQIKSFNKVGKKYGYSGARVRQLEQQFLWNCRHYMKRAQRSLQEQN